LTGSQLQLQLQRKIRFRTRAGLTSDEWKSQLTSVWEAEKTFIASVVPALYHTLAEALQDRYWLLVDFNTPRTFDLALPHPEQLGADRLANVMGALNRFAPPFLIIDSGTATTFCVVDSNRRYRGGAIVPGIEVSFSALQSRAAKLFSVDLVRPASSLGNTTELQLQSGLIHGTEALIEGLSQRLLQEAGLDYQSTKKIITGGCGHFLKLPHDFDFVPELTLEGLLHYGWEVQKNA
jgi:type III pantothenate kinase